MTWRGPANAIACATLLLALPGNAALGQDRPDRDQPDQGRPGLFEQVRRTVETHFFDPKLNGADWQALGEIHGPRAKQAQTQEERAAVINKMLAALKTSHTRLFTPEEPAYYQMLGIFLPGNDELRKALQAALPDAGTRYSGIGIFTEDIDGETFVRAVLDGAPAAEAGLLAGDRLIEADGQPFHAIRSFAGKAERPVTLLIQRTPDPAGRREIVVRPKMLDGRRMFRDAMRASVAVIERAGRRIGYVHVWSYAGRQYQRILERTLLSGRLSDADALVLDLREGWGGASPDYLNIFTRQSIAMTGSGRDGESFTLRSGWSKPVVVLVNRTARSGKELLAYGFRRLEIGPVVGTATAGALVAGRLFVMDDGSLLYLAVQDVLVDGDLRLEGVGVAPDIEVPFDLPYAQGADPQKDRAIEAALDLIERPR